MAETNKVKSKGKWPADEPTPVGNERQRQVAKEIADAVRGVKEDPKKVEDDKHAPKPTEPTATLSPEAMKNVLDVKQPELKGEGTVTKP